MTNSGNWNSWCAPISLKNSMELFQSSKKTFCIIYTHIPFSLTDSTNQCKALQVILNPSGVESLFLGSEQLRESYIVIGAHQDFQTPEFVLPELLLKEPWFCTALRSLRRRSQTFLSFYIICNRSVLFRNHCKVLHTPVNRTSHTAVTILV